VNRSIIACGIGVLAAAVGSTGVAAAAPSGVGSASDVVQSLQAQGYNVVVHGAVDEPLSSCTVTGVHDPERSGHTAGLTTVYVDVSCPIGN